MIEMDQFGYIFYNDLNERDRERFYTLDAYRVIGGDGDRFHSLHYFFVSIGYLYNDDRVMTEKMTAIRTLRYIGTGIY